MEKSYYGLKLINNHTNKTLIKMSSTFPTQKILNLKLRKKLKEYIIIYFYVKDINGNFIVTRIEYINSKHQYYINKFNIRRNLKNWIIKVNNHSSLFNNMSNRIERLENKKAEIIRKAYDIDGNISDMEIEVDRKLVKLNSYLLTCQVN